MKNNNFIKNKLLPFLLMSAFVVSSDIVTDNYTSTCSAVKRRIIPKKKLINKFVKKINRNKRLNKKNNLKKYINKRSDKKEENKKDILKYDFSKWNKTAGNLIVINKNNEVSKDFKPNLEKCGEKQVGKQMYDDLCRMIEDAKKVKIKLWVCSGYRSIEHQEKLFKAQVEREKLKKSKNPEQDASKVVAKPRQSEHNIALAIDINCVDSQFKDTKAYKWLKEHAQDYGFIERYQEDWEEKTGCIPEPWHWRYVGVKNAQKIKKSGKCLEEYVIDIIKN